MAIWYWDPVGGNNANDGTTFANRKLTLQSLSSVAAGDTVKCIKSPDIVSTGINATWTDGSNTVTLASSQTQLIASCDSNWTAATNVTCTTNTNRKEGTNSQDTAVAAGFTTGKASYFATGTLDCSGYQQLTFWYMQTSGTLAVAGDYSMKLCSDTIGATPVNDFALPAVPALNQWQIVTVDLATNLGASIQSVAFYVNVDRAAVTFRFDNINVSQAAASAGAITLSSLISKNSGSVYTTEPFFGIRSISGTTVTLDSAPQYTLNLSGTEPTYSGTTETVALYRRETLKTVNAANTTDYVNYYAGATGSSVNRVTISGGWNTTDMTTQTGVTYLDGRSGYGYGFALSNGALNIGYVDISAINCVRYFVGMYLYVGATSLSNTLTCSDLNNNAFAGCYATNYLKTATLSITNLVKNGYDTTTYGMGCYVYNTGTNNSTISIVNASSNWLNGFHIGHSSYGAYNNGNTITITNCNRNSLVGCYSKASISNTFNISNLLNNNIVGGGTYSQFKFDSGYTVNTGNNATVNPHNNILNVGNVSQAVSTAGNGITFGPGADNNKVIMTGVFSGFTSNGYPCIAAEMAGTNYFTSASSVFSTTQKWAIAGGASKLYISTTDTAAPILTYTTGSSAQIVVKNAFGMIGQDYVVPANSWGIS